MTQLTIRECIWGDKNFYRHAVTIALPIILQNTLSSVVSLLDNVMVGQVGTLPMSAVAIANQLFFIYLLCIFASMSGAGIFGAQFYGQGNMEGVRHAFRLKQIVGIVFTLGAVLIFSFGARPLVQIYISPETSSADATATMEYALQYIRVMLPGLVPFAFSNAYASTLRESGDTALPMAASMAAMAINFVLNAILIFGLLGFPAMGVVGAGIATSVSRFAELGIVAYGSHKNTDKYVYMKGLYSSFTIPWQLAKRMLLQSVPLIANEFLWSSGQAVLLQSYSVRGIQVIAAINIANTVAMIFNQVYLSLGNSASIMVGQQLGAGETDNARRTAWRMITLSGLTCLVLGAALTAVSGVIPLIYNTEPAIRLLASQLLRRISLCMLLFSTANAMYFVLRSGGKTFITFLFDSCFTWCANIPMAYYLSRYTSLDVPTVYLLVNGLDVIKCGIGFWMVKKGIWIHNLVSENQ